jgi:hypothetical protein
LKKISNRFTSFFRISNWQASLSNQFPDGMQLLGFCRYPELPTYRTASRMMILPTASLDWKGTFRSYLLFFKNGVGTCGKPAH